VRCFLDDAVDGVVADEDVGGVSDAIRVEVVDLREACAVLRGGKFSCWRHGDAAARSVGTPEAVVGAFVLQGDVCIIGASGRMFCDEHRTVWSRSEAQWTDPFDDMEDARCTAWSSGDVECVLQAKGSTWRSTGSRQSDTMSAPDRFVDAGQQRLALGVGHGFRCELLLDRGVRCHGDNTRLVLGSRDARATDIALEQLRDVQELQVADELSCTRHVDDRVFCWGRNDRGQIGRNPSLPTWLPEPTLAELPLR
jgi:hypothetical protein